MNSSSTPQSNNHCPVERFAAMWQRSDERPDVFAFLANHAGISPEDAVEICRIDQANRWNSGSEFPVERYLEKIEPVGVDKRLKIRLVQHEYHCQRQRGLNPEIDSFVTRFPELAEILKAHLPVNDQQTGERPAVSMSNSPSPTILPDKRINGKPASDSDAPTVPFVEPAKPYKPDFIGRYRVLSVLGDGGFGRVYLAQDEVLNRKVAIKTPHHHLVSRPADIESYLTEARIVSSLDHHFIVPVFDCGHTDDGLCFIVSKYIDGSDLATKVKQTPLANAAAADLVATVAEALHYAHVKGVVHRDIKPANILIDSQGRPYLADFGIALREEDFGTGHTRLGTIVYMSPEQLRGEGHLVDGRSDIFSLGVVLYELLTGRRPFPQNRFEHSASIEPRPPRQIDDSIAKELERICLKALSYRVVDRYNTASDMASDLHSFLQLGTSSQGPPPKVQGLSGQSNNATSGNQAAETGIQIVPKGLRSFDRDDAGFFLELLPGPRDRDGLPESVRFWKSRIQAPESEAFRVGVIYGPSGCGKSSFLKAGVLPQLTGDIVAVYVESTPLETETRLLRALRKACPELPSDLGLSESMTALRRQRRGTSGRRLLIVIDQFEQWLHTRPKDDSGELVKALRQCDGVHLQCIITVRDDFWMAVTHFMNELEVSLVPGNNLASIDLFNLRHAKKVLTAIGQAYGILPTNAQEIDKEHKSFISKAVADLAHDDQVIPVQLALFAEMIKDKVWTTATLRSVGGIEGVGVTFLEETFNGRTAPPHHRLHQKAARAVLQALLSEGVSGIKGEMRSYQELLQASGYTDNPREFDSLLRILDSELRLITPTDPEGLDSGGPDAVTSSNERERYYHLTHDYLVPSLREWLTRKRKETRRGRVELLLADRASVWNQKPSDRSLPSFFEWSSILLFAGRRSRHENRRLLAASARYYGSRAIAGCLLLGLAVWGTRQQIHQNSASAIVESLASVRGQDLLKTIERLGPYRRVADPLLHQAIQSAESSTAGKGLRAAMALLPVDPKQESVVYEGMLTAAPDDFAAIRDSLMKWGDNAALTKRLWKDLLEPRSDEETERRFRAGVALAAFDGPGDRLLTANWKQATRFLAEELIAEIRANLGYFDHWVSALRPARHVLYTDLDQMFSKPDGPEIDRHAAATVLADFAKDQPDKLADLILRASPREYAVLIPKLKELGQQGRSALQLEFNVSIPTSASLDEQNRIAKRRAHAAVALLEFEATEPLITVLSVPADNPILGTYAEDRLSKLGTHPEILFRLMERADVGLRASLMRSLAGMTIDRFPREFREQLILEVTRLFKSDPDSGVHSAAEWALRSWGLKDQLARLTTELGTSGPVNDRRWYINPHGHTMIIFKGPIDSKTGSPPDEPARDASDEGFVTRRIERDFAVCSTEVTIDQFLEFMPKFRHANNRIYSPTSDCPIAMITWYRAAEYCNWLSKMEGIPPEQWCYKMSYILTKTSKSPNGERMETMQPEEGYLSRNGYRLLTEAEWEYACRAGTTTPYSWGADPEAASRYARTIRNSNSQSSAVGSLCPNRFGLFDMHGNVSEWVHDRYIEEAIPVSGNDTEDLSEINDDSTRGMRGGNAVDFQSSLRSANRIGGKARNGLSSRIGFRIGRTIASVHSSR